MIIILPLIVLLNTVGPAWAGRGSNGVFSVPIYMILTFLGMALLLVSSGYLIVKKYIEERKEKVESSIFKCLSIPGFPPAQE